MKYLFLLFIFMSYQSWAQDPYNDLNAGFRQFGEVMLATSGDVDSLALARSSSVGECAHGSELDESYNQRIDLGLTPPEDKPSKWRFSVMYSMGGPKDSLAKNYAEKGDHYRELGNELDQIIGQNFSSQEQRMDAVRAACNGKSEVDRIAMASNLGSRLSNIYDYGRAEGGATSDIVVSSENQWQALHARAGGDMSATAGVCRDASMTVSQFLMACGFDRDQVAIEGFRTVGGGHQVVTVRTKDGVPYTINWSELYASDENGHAAPAPNPNLINTGLFYSVYDPVTGKIVERRRTELGEVLKAVAGGTPDDPNNLPELIRLEAGYGVIAANVFKTTTARGDFAKGVALYLQDNNGEGFLDLSAGVAYANNERTVATSANSESTLTQNIVYGQVEGRFNIPDLMLVDRDDQSFSLRPSAIVMTEGYISSDSQDGDDAQTNFSVNTQSKVGLDALYNKGNLGLYGGGEIDFNLSDKGYNNEQGTPGEKGSLGGPTPFANSYNVHGGVSLEGTRFTTAATADYTIARSGTRTALGATFDG